MKIKGKKKKKKTQIPKEKDVVVKGKKKSKGKKERRKWWKILLTVCIIGFIACILAVFSFFLYIVVTTGEFDPNALANKDRSIIYDSDGNEFATLGMENRESVTYDKLPDVFVDALIATEDSRFFQHNGVDVARFTKAAFLQVLGNSSAGGASTLTMQVVKNNLTSTERTGIQGIIRKFRDVYLAVFFMEKKYTKEEIIEYYVNDSALGGGCYGVEEASKYYFGKSVSDLNLAEASMIAGLFQAPNGYNPYRNPEGATKRRSTVLKLMVRHGYITQEEADIANSISIESLLVGESNSDSKYQSYIDTVIDEVEEKTGESPYNVPMKIYTNMKTSIQDGISNIMSGNTDDYTWKDDYVQAGVTVVDVKTGAIAAIGGGRNRKGARTLNYATQTYRQPGSTAKPIFAYGPGFEYNNFSTYELFNDEAWSYTGGINVNNWDGGYQGLITLKQAVAVSRNVPAVKAFQQVGAKNVVKFVQSLGINLKDTAYESYAIGGLDKGVTTLQMAGAYAAFANGGYYAEPYTVSKIVYRETGEEKDMTSERKQVMKDSTAYLMTNVLHYAATNGFSGGTNGYAGTVAVKTGTSNYPDTVLQKYGLPGSAVNDLWSVGYTPEYSFALWYGYDEISSEHYSTVGTPKDQLMRAIMKYIPVCKDEFKAPSSVVASQVEFGTWPAQLPSDYTPSDLIRTEYFIKGAQPTEVSSRFSKLGDVTGLKVTTSGNSVTVTWTENKPDVVKEDYLKEYFSQKVFGNGTSNFLSERLSYNQNTLGGFGYGIYVKDSSGNTTQVGFTNTNSYTFKPSSGGNLTVIVKAQYKNFTANASDGVSTKVVASGGSNGGNNGSSTTDVSIKLNGNSALTIQKGNYDDSGVKVSKDGKDITSECTFSYKVDENIVSSISDITRKINEISESGTHTITYIATYEGKAYKIERTVTIQ